MDFLSYLSSKKKMRLPLSFLVVIVSFILCSHRLHGIIIYNDTNNEITIISFDEMTTPNMRFSGSGKFWFEINKNNNTILPRKFVGIKNTVHSNYLVDGKRDAKFSCLLLNVQQDGKKYEFNTLIIQKNTRRKLKEDYVVLWLANPTSEEDRSTHYLYKHGNRKWDDLNIRFFMMNEINDMKNSEKTS